MNPDDALRELLALGELKDMKQLSGVDSGSGATFWSGTLVEGDVPAFVKHYRYIKAETVERGLRAADRLAELVKARELQHFEVLAPLRRWTLSDGSMVVVTRRFTEPALSVFVKARKKFDRAQSQRIRDGLFDCAEAFRDSKVTHCDCCVRNMVLIGEKLFLYDFDGAIYDEHITRHNPTFRSLKSLGGMGGYAYVRRGHWNDVAAVARTYELLMPLLDLDHKKEDLAALEAKAKMHPTFEIEYTADDTWRKEMRMTYLKLLCRPLWTYKTNVRRKMTYVHEVIFKLMRKR